MPPKRTGPAAGGAAIRAGYRVAEQHFDTPNRTSAQPFDHLRRFQSLGGGAPAVRADIELPDNLSVHNGQAAPRAKDGDASAALSFGPTLGLLGTGEVISLSVSRGVSGAGLRRSRGSR
jgi:hypothetical protein